MMMDNNGMERVTAWALRDTAVKRLQKKTRQNRKKRRCVEAVDE